MIKVYTEDVCDKTRMLLGEYKSEKEANIAKTHFYKTWLGEEGPYYTRGWINPSDPKEEVTDFGSWSMYVITVRE